MQQVNLFFSPFAYIWPHERLEVAFRNHLQSKGERVLVLRCSGQCWSMCHVKHAAGQAEKQLGQAVCHRCQRAALVHVRARDLRWLGTDAAATNLPRQQAESSELSDRVRRYVTHDYLLTRRKRFEDLTETDQTNIEASLSEALHIYADVLDLVKCENVTRIFYYNDVYAVNQIARDVAHQFNVETVNLHLSMTPWRMHDRYVVSESGEDLLLRRKSPRHSPPLTRRQCIDVRKAIDFQIYGKSPFLYSVPGTKSRKKKNPDEFDCILILSSHDEMEALKFLYPEALQHTQYDQAQTIEWFKLLAAQHPERSFLVRPHPREFKNRRHPTETVHARLLLNQLANLPSNITVDEPGMGISMFDRIRSCRCVLFTWSSAGLDALALGKQVACSTPQDLTWCPSDLFQTVNSFEDLDAFFQQSFVESGDPRLQVKALRWYGWFLTDSYQSFSWIRFRYSPTRILQGILGRTGFFSGALLASCRKVEALLSRRVEFSSRQSNMRTTFHQIPANKYERRLLSHLKWP